MRVGNVLRFLGGSIGVYVIMAACSSAGSSVIGGDDGGAGVHGDGSSGDGAALIDGQGIADAVLDAIMNPVGDAKADTNVSGSRLKARNYVGSDGSKEWMGWHDIQRNEDCAFTTAADGMMRCLPFPYQATINLYYTDAGCTQPLAIGYKGCATTYATFSEAVAGSCVYNGTNHLHIYQLGGAFTGLQAFVKSGASCTATPTTSLTGTYDLYSVGPEVDPSSFVAATIQVDP